MNNMLEPDPSNWTVDEVVKFFCISTRPKWAPMPPPRDPTAIEKSLRANDISGYTLLNFVDNTVLRDDLKIKAFGDRTFIIVGIKWLQQRSLAFLSQSTQKDSQNTIPSVPYSAPPESANKAKAPRRFQLTLVAESVPSQQTVQSTYAALTDNDPLVERILRNYPPQSDDDSDVLEQSDSDVSDDIKRKEDPVEEEAADSASKSKVLSAAQVNSELDAYVKTQRVRWQQQKLPREQQRAHKLWRERGNSTLKQALEGETTHLQNRLGDLRQAIHRAEHTSDKAVHKACASLDQTLSDLFGFKWKLKIISSSQPPVQVNSPKLLKPSPSKQDQDFDGNETLGSDYSDLEEEGHATEGTDSPVDVNSFDSKDLETESNSVPWPGQFESVSGDQNEFNNLVPSEEGSLSEEHASKRLRIGMEIEFATFDPEIPLPSQEIDEWFVPMIQGQDAKVQDFADSDDMIGVFEQVFPMMWKNIELSGNRESLLAKSLITLSNAKFDEFSFYLGHYKESIYKTEVEDALKAMCEDKLVVEGCDPTNNHQKMLLASLFISWINRIQLSDEGLQTNHVHNALEALKPETQEDGDENASDTFSKFWLTLDSLVTACPKWKALSISESIELSDNQGAAKRKRRRRYVARKPLSDAQQQAQDRQIQQDKEKLDLDLSLTLTGVRNKDATQKAVSFKEPIIYLDAHISQYTKPHQLDGIQFMFREIVENQQPEGCLLAHTMGLGKTMQVISLLVTIAAAGASEDPAIRTQIPPALRQSKTLILCPASLIQNWCDEFAMWMPKEHQLGNLIALKSGGVDKKSIRYEQIVKWNEDGGVLILSYDLFRITLKNTSNENRAPLDELEYEKVENCLLNGPTLVVADEAQILRTRDSQVSKLATRFRTSKRIAISGSPLATSLLAYYWMIDWIAPKFLEDLATFKSEFVKTIEQASDFDSTIERRRQAIRVQEKLNLILKPKIQRHDMSVLQDHLPPKQEFTIFFALSPIQKAAYNHFVAAVRQGTAAGMKSRLWSWLGTLQLCCNHPWVLRQILQRREENPKKKSVASAPKPRPTPTEDDICQTILFKINNLFIEVADNLCPSLSNRVLILNKIIEESLKCEDKVLVFSQSIPTLDYLEAMLRSSGRSYRRLDEKLPAGHRQEVVQEFNANDRDSIFLILTRAGGEGLDIQGANRIVIFDFSFTPMWEQQAISCAYRLGQKKPVYVYRLVSAGTFEEQLYKKTLFKSNLAIRVVDRDSFLRAGSRNTPWYLLDCQNVICDADINHEECEKDIHVMTKLLHSEAAKTIFGVTILGDRFEDEKLTANNFQSVEAELRLRRLRIDQKAVSEKQQKGFASSASCAS